jgi:hypothetical protein
MINLFLVILIVSFLIALKNPRILKPLSFKQFRVLFPSWRFFESLTPIPKVYYRISFEDQSVSDWQEFYFHEPTRKWHHLFFNPMANLRLTYRVQIEQLLNDVAETHCYSENFHKSLISYQIVSTFLKNELHDRYGENCQRFQFKIGVLQFEGATFETLPTWSESIVSPESEVS